MFGSLLKATVGAITVPVAVVKDVVTLGGALDANSLDDRTHTERHLSKVVENINNAIESD